MRATFPIRFTSVTLACAALALTGCSETGRTPLEPEGGAPPAAHPDANRTLAAPTSQQLVTGLEGASGSTVGPGGALFVTEGAAGRISRVDPGTGDVTTFASGLPPALVGIGGVVDVVFLGATAYALVTLVSDPLFPTGEVNGIYRVDGPNSFTLIADIGAYNIANPPSGFDYFLKTGVLYALELHRGALLVTDGHLNRVLRVTLDGAISELMTFGNTVPTGLDVQGDTIFMAEAGPSPHAPGDGRIVTFAAGSTEVTEMASGAPLLVDVERGRGQTFFALSQGDWDGAVPGDPALPGTGALVRVESDGTFAEVLEGLDQPTSLEIIGGTAFVVTLQGEVWTIDHISNPPYGVSR